MGGERLWIPGVKESKPKRLGFKIRKNDVGLCEEQRELQFSGRNEAETESTEGEVFQANSQSADQNNVPRQAENANFANSVNLDLHTSVIDVDVVHQVSNEANQTNSPHGSQDSTKRAQSTIQLTLPLLRLNASLA